MAANLTVVTAGSGIRKEGAAGGTITPGHLVTRNSSDAIVVHPAAAGAAQCAFALEDDLQGNDINDNYTVGNQVLYEVLPAGAEVNAILKEGENAAIGAFLASAGNGELQVILPDASATVAESHNVVAKALEALDLSDSSGADPASRRLKVECM